MKKPVKRGEEPPRKPKSAAAVTGAPSKIADKLGRRDTMGYRIAQARESIGLTQTQLAEALGKNSHGTVSHWESGHSEPRDLDTIRAIARLTGNTPEYIAFGIEEQEPVTPETLGYWVVPEVVFESLRNRREAAKWGVPLDWVRGELRADHDHLLLYRMPVEAGAYEYGDRLVVDTSQAACQPSPRGSFLYWDGFGPAVAHISVLPVDGKRKRRARMTTGAGNKNAVEVEVDVDSLKIIGRVRAYWRKAE